MGALRERNFRLLFIAKTASSFGNTLVPVALAFAILDLTKSPSDLGFVLGSSSAAQVAFLLIGGVIADRYSRKAIMISVDVIRGTCQVTEGLLLVLFHPSMIALAGLGVIVGGSSAIFSPASNGLTPGLVRPENLQQANALQQIASSGAGIIGPAVAGILVVSVGPGWAIIIDGITFFMSTLLLSFINLQNAPRRRGKKWLRELQDGWTYFWSVPWFKSIVMGASFFNLLYAAYTVMGPVVSQQDFAGAKTWAIVSSVDAIGAIFGGLVATKLRPKRPLYFAMPLVGLSCLAPFSFAGHLPVPLIAGFAASGAFGIVVFEALYQTILQQQVPEQMLSRASSYDYFGSLVAYPIGLAVAGPLAAILGTKSVLVFIGALQLVFVVVMMSISAVRNVGSQITVKVV